MGTKYSDSSVSNLRYQNQRYRLQNKSAIAKRFDTSTASTVYNAIMEKFFCKLLHICFVQFKG